MQRQKTYPSTKHQEKELFFIEQLYLSATKTPDRIISYKNGKVNYGHVLYIGKTTGSEEKVNMTRLVESHE